MNKCVDHDCLSVLSRVFLCLDGRLSEAEEKEFLIEVDRCPYCLEQYDIEKAFKEFLHQKLSIRKVNPELISRIRDSITRQSG